MHVGMITIDGEKMSKSVGNVKSVNHVLENWGPNVIRLFCLSGKYSNPIDYSEKLLKENITKLRQIESCYYELRSSEGTGEEAAAEKLVKECKEKLDSALNENQLQGITGISHTRWATHGIPSENNAHPHMSAQTIAIVHNGIIENHAELRDQQTLAGHEFTSDTDTEVVVNLVYDYLQKDMSLVKAVSAAICDLEGAYALGVVTVAEPDTLVVARRGSPLIIGLGIGENYIASDVFALLPVTQRFIFLEDGDLAEINLKTGISKLLTVNRLGSDPRKKKVRGLIFPQRK